MAKAKFLLNRREKQLLDWMLTGTQDWRGAIVGNPDPVPLEEFDELIHEAEALVKKLKACEIETLVTEFKEKHERQSQPGET